MPKQDLINPEEIQDLIKKDAVKVFKQFINSINELQISKNREQVRKAASTLINKIKTKSVSASDFQKFYESIIGPRVKVKAKIQRDRMPNAWVNLTPIYDAKKPVYGYKHAIQITVTTGAIRRLKPEELIAVLLHEIGHYFYVSKSLIKKYKLLMWNMVFLGSAASAGALIVRDEEISSKTKMIVYVSVAVLFLSYLLLNYLVEKRSKAMEKIADSYASYMGFGHYLASAFEKMYWSPKWLKKSKKSKSLLKKALYRIAYVFYKVLESSPEYESARERICRVITISLKDPKLPDDLKRHLESQRDIYC